MAYEVPGRIIGTLLATGDLSALQYTFVQVTTLGGVTGTTVNTQAPIGILQNAPTAGQPAEIMTEGVSKLVAGTSALVPNDIVGSTAGGKAATLTSGNGSFIAARVLEGTTSTTFNGLITVYVYAAQALR